MGDFFLPLGSATAGRVAERPDLASHTPGLRLIRAHAVASWVLEIRGRQLHQATQTPMGEFLFAQASLDRAQLVALCDAIDAALHERDEFCDGEGERESVELPDLQTQACPAPHERVVAMVSDASHAQLYVGLLGELRRVTPAEEDLLVYRIQVIVALDSWWRRMSASAREAALRLVREDRDLRFFLLTSSVGDSA